MVVLKDYTKSYKLPYSKYILLVLKSHLESYPCPLSINYIWNFGFLLGINIIIQIITGLLLTLYYTSYINSINTRGYFTGLTILISLPTGTKIFNWLIASMRQHLFPINKYWKQTAARRY